MLRLPSRGGRITKNAAKTIDFYTFSVWQMETYHLHAVRFIVLERNIENIVIRRCAKISSSGGCCPSFDSIGRRSAQLTSSLVVCDECGHTKFPFSFVILSWGERGELWLICHKLPLILPWARVIPYSAAAQPQRPCFSPLRLKILSETLRSGKLWNEKNSDCFCDVVLGYGQAPFFIFYRPFYRIRPSLVLSLRLTGVQAVPRIQLATDSGA